MNCVEVDASQRTTNIPLLGQIRLASADDAANILGLVNESMSKTFRISDSKSILNLINDCVMSVCQLDENERVVGFLALQDYPLILSVDPAAWEEYVWTKYRAIELTARNTLFIHLICWNANYARDIVDNMLRAVFMHDHYLHYIAMVKSLVQCTVLMPGQVRAEASFRRLQAMERGISADCLPSFYVADRKEVCQRVLIRRAVEEDNDDIVPIIERHSTRLRELYGDYYISELISRHPESERVLLVCEYKEYAIGVVCLNTQINYEALEENFELSPFTGLRHIDDLPQNKVKDVTESMVSLPGLISGQGTGNTADTVIKDVKSAMAWSDNLEETWPPRESVEEGRMNLQEFSSQLDILNLLEDEDEEELEFDIVNIHIDWLRGPLLISYEDMPQKGLGLAEDISRILNEKHRESMDGDKNTNKDKMKKSSVATSGVQHKLPEPTHYTGRPNAFIIELFAIHPDHDERFGFYMLEEAFGLFPDRDYCIICLPSRQPPLPLLEHFTLVTPYSTKKRFINESLFVAHINSVKGEVRVRRAEEYDIPYLKDILEHSPKKHEFLQLLHSSFISSELDSYVLLSQNQPVGVIVLGPLEDTSSVQLHYSMKPMSQKSGKDGNILLGILSPALEPHSRWYLRDVLRQSGYDNLFWSCRLFTKGDSSPSRNLMSFVSHMVPVQPRQSIQNLCNNNETEKMHRESLAPFALWSLQRPLTSVPKVYINNSIVVIGASRTGLSFLETLIMGPTAPYLTFTNLTLVSEHGLPTLAECLRAADTCVPRDGRYTDRYLKSVPFYFYLDVLSAVVVRIDRKKKCVYLKGGGVKYYDELILTCGKEFQQPHYLKESRDVHEPDENYSMCGRLPMDNPKYKPDSLVLPPDVPDNVMIINSLFQSNTCLRKLLRMIAASKGKIETISSGNTVVVYGDCVEAYSCIAGLLELGVMPDMITYVEPFPPEDPAALRINCFNNETVDARVQTSLDKLGIRVLRESYLTGWSMSSSRVEGLHLMTLVRTTYLPCFALFYYGTKALDIHAFKAINECGLVYDGGLVVSPTFETNDPYIYGAGPCVRYSRRLHAKRWAHRYYGSEDVGNELATLFLQKLDPFIMGRPDDFKPSDILARYSSSYLGCKSSFFGSESSVSRYSYGVSRRWQPVMKFDSPIVKTATLPGPLYYLNMRKPGLKIPMAIQLCLPHQGHTLLTDKGSNYFRLQLNIFHVVESATCLNKKPYCWDNIVQIYGKHEAFFNKLLTRYQMGLVDDLFEYFAQPWMSLIYQEGFRNLMDDINEQDVGTIFDLLNSKFSTVKNIARQQEYDQETCTSVPSCGYVPTDKQRLGTFRSVINKFVARKSSQLPRYAARGSDLPNAASEDGFTEIQASTEMLKSPLYLMMPCVEAKYVSFAMWKSGSMYFVLCIVVDGWRVADSRFSECGQSAIIRDEARAFWQTVGGERIVIAHLARYLEQNYATNKNYATIKPDI